MLPRPSPLIEALIRLVVTVALGLLLVETHGSSLLQSLVPPFRAEISALTPDLRITKLEIGQNRGQTVYALEAATARYLAVGSRAIPGGVGMTASTLAGHVYQVPLVVFVVVLSWPGLGWARRLLAVMFAFPACALVLSLDVPFVLAGSLRDVIDQIFDPGAWSPLSAWMNTLNGGGRLALSLFAGVSAVALARGLAGPAQRSTPE